MLSLSAQPEFINSSFRYFEKGEYHVSRFCPTDVLLIVFHGTLRFRENGVPAEVSAGEYYIQKHGMYQDAAEPSDSPQYYYLHFIGQFDTGTHQLPLRGEVQPSPLFPLFRELDLLQATNASLVSKTAVFDQILAYLEKSRCASAHDSLIAAIVSDYMADLRTGVTLSDLSKRYGYSQNQLIRIFREETGTTPHDYLLSLRLRLARQLMVASRKTIQQISEECGFGDYINFYKAYKKKYGVPPSDDRQ